MFKAILLGQWHSLSDPESEHALAVRADFLVFCDFDDMELLDALSLSAVVDERGFIKATFGEAVRLITDPEQTTSPEDWHLGLFLNQQWLHQQSEQLLEEFVHLKQCL